MAKGDFALSNALADKKFVWQIAAIVKKLTLFRLDRVVGNAINIQINSLYVQVCVSCCHQRICFVRFESDRRKRDMQIDSLDGEYLIQVLVHWTSPQPYHPIDSWTRRVCHARGRAQIFLKHAKTIAPEATY